MYLMICGSSRRQSQTSAYLQRACRSETILAVNLFAPRSKFWEQVSLVFFFLDVGYRLAIGLHDLEIVSSTQIRPWK